MPNISWKTITCGLLVATSGALFAPGSQAKPLTEIKVSYQPAVYWALPFYIATQKGWWAELGLKPKFSVFPAGVPQMAASASKSWDVGSTGSVPALLGFQRFGIQLIGMSNDESAANDLMVRKDKAAEYTKDPQAIKGQPIVLTANSTGDYAVQSCLKKFGITKADVTIKSMGQSEIMSAMSSGNATLGGLWAPNTYTMEEKTGAKILCSGKDAGVVIPGALVVRAEYAKEHPEDVAKFLAIYERGWKWANAHRKEAVAMMGKFYNEGGVNISEAAMNKEFDTRPTFDLANQLKVMNRSKGASEADGWFTKIAEFMKGNGSIRSIPNPKDYLIDQFFKRVEADPTLSAFANNAN
ncbi:MAG: nitrate ABC transporter substrate-binding protein [Candidimonas sp.]|nr:MAG: nitrate ABC transporter substrate-binding protein [Candidimonas sp.]